MGQAYGISAKTWGKHKQQDKYLGEEAKGTVLSVKTLRQDYALHV